MIYLSMKIYSKLQWHSFKNNNNQFTRCVLFLLQACFPTVQNILTQPKETAMLQFLSQRPTQNPFFQETWNFPQQYRKKTAILQFYSQQTNRKIPSPRYLEFFQFTFLQFCLKLLKSCWSPLSFNLTTQQWNQFKQLISHS